MARKKKQSLVNKLSNKITEKNILKKGQTTITIKEREPTNIFNEESKFFKKEIDLIKMEMFFK